MDDEMPTDWEMIDHLVDVHGPELIEPFRAVAFSGLLEERRLVAEILRRIGVDKWDAGIACGLPWA